MAGNNTGNEPAHRCLRPGPASLHAGLPCGGSELSTTLLLRSSRTSKLVEAVLLARLGAALLLPKPWTTAVPLLLPLLLGAAADAAGS